MAFTLAHLSDPHLPPLPRLGLVDLFSKRLFGTLNWWRGRDAIHRMEILERLVADIRQQKPDHIVVTGDLTNLGLRQEFEAVRNWLPQLGLPEQVTVVPGNHDSYVPGALETGLDILDGWLAPDGQRSAGGSFPFIRRRGDIALVGLSSAIATRPFLAIGRIGGHQLARLADMLEALAREKTFRILLLHHALHVRKRQFSKRLIDAGATRTVLTAAGAELILHGHLHLPTTHRVRGPHGFIPVFGVPSASADPIASRAAAGYALYRIEQNDEDWRLTVTRRTLNEHGAFEISSPMNFTIPRNV